MKREKILMLVRTSGLEYDDRIRKEVITLQKLGYEVTLLANYTDNKESKGYTQYNARFKVFKLWTRIILPSAKFLQLKMFEFWLRIFFETLFTKYAFIWVHEEYMMLNVLFKPVKGKYILDLHELPEVILRKSYGVKLYRKIESKTHAVIVANNERLGYMKEINLVFDLKKYHVLNNFPDKLFEETDVKALDEKIISFLKGDEYILLQGGGHITRFPEQVLKAIQSFNKYKTIIVGPIHPSIDELIDRKYTDIVYKAGYIKQMELPAFFDNAKFTIVLYDSDSPNSLYCEPNRMYQAIVRETPLIVGSNPTMKAIIEKNIIGVVLKTDGRDWKDIYDALNKMDQYYSVYKNNILEVKTAYQWDEQEYKFHKILQS